MCPESRQSAQSTQHASWLWWTASGWVSRGQSHRDQMSADKELASSLRAMDNGESLMLTMQVQGFVHEDSVP